MFNSLNRPRVQWMLFLSGVALAIYYFLVYLPLSKTVAGLDEPLRGVMQQLIVTNGETVEVLNHAATAEQLRRILEAGKSLEKARAEVLSRIALDPALAARLKQPFQLIDFQNERQLKIEELGRMARENKVQVDPKVIEAYPKYSPTQERPAELWSELAMMHYALALAVHARVPIVKSARMLEGQAHRSGTGAMRLEEQRVQVEMAGPALVIAQFLADLPKPGKELKGSAGPEVIASKPSMFVEKWMLRKSSATNPDEVVLDAVITGFVKRERTEGGLDQLTVIPR